MPYTINRYSGEQIAVVADGTVDSTLDIKLIGKNYAGYGEIQNENLVYLLENFASGRSPARPISGQVWFDSSTNKLKFFTGSQWKTTGGAEVGPTNQAPSGLAEGDFWFDTTTNQLYAWSLTGGLNDGPGFVLVGPQAAGANQTEMESRLVKDTIGAQHPIIAAVVNGQVMFVISAETSPFTLGTLTPISGFTEIHPGITLAFTSDSTTLVPGRTTSPTRLWGTATDADKLGGIEAANYLRGDITTTFTHRVEFGDDGYTVGLPNRKLYVYIHPDGYPIVQSNTNTFWFQTKGAQVKTPLKLVDNNIEPDEPDLSNIGSSTRKYLTVYANNFEGIASEASKLTLGGVGKSASLSASPLTIAARDSMSNLYANEFHGTATQAQYADLAEKYLPDQEYETGTVLIVGGTAEVTACAPGFRAIGAVSANPAFKMNSELEGGVYVALKGRVPVKVVGSVLKGQRLVAGPNGTAQAAFGNNADTFAIALESNNDAGSKLVECLIL